MSQCGLRKRARARTYKVLQPTTPHRHILPLALFHHDHENDPAALKLGLLFEGRGFGVVPTTPKPLRSAQSRSLNRPSPSSEIIAWE